MMSSAVARQGSRCARSIVRPFSPAPPCASTPLPTASRVAAFAGTGAACLIPTSTTCTRVLVPTVTTPCSSGASFAGSAVPARRCSRTPAERAAHASGQDHGPAMAASAERIDGIAIAAFGAALAEAAVVVSPERNRRTSKARLASMPLPMSRGCSRMARQPRSSTSPAASAGSCAAAAAPRKSSSMQRRLRCLAGRGASLRHPRCRRLRKQP